MSIAMMDGIFSYFFYTPFEWTGNLFFFPRDNLANVGTSERKLTGNAKIEQQQQEFSSSLETREERKKNSSDWMLLASSLLLCIRSLTKDNFPPLAFPLPIVA
jgi:hypothetical protein